jgi:hypothetical protein
MIFKSSKMTAILHKPKTEEKQPEEKQPEQKQPVVQKSSKPTAELPRPGRISDLVGKYLVSAMKMDPDLVPILLSVTAKRAGTEKTFDVRIFDEPESLVKKVTVNNYKSLDDHPELILYEGWFDNATKHVELTTRREVAKIQIFNEAEILKQIEGLTEPGSTVSFFQAVGPNLGGPLGRGAFIVELNPNYPAHGKKYNGYSVNVFGTELAGKGTKSWDSNKAKDIAKWVKSNHHKRAF